MKYETGDVVLLDDGLAYYFERECEYEKEYYFVNTSFLNGCGSLKKIHMNRIVRKIGKTDKIDNGLYEINEYVLYNMSSKNHNQVVKIDWKAHNPNRGWVYGIQYSGIDKEKQTVINGGSSSSWEESCFKKLEDAEIKLITKKFELNKQRDRLKSEVSVLDKNIEKLEYALYALK